MFRIDRALKIFRQEISYMLRDKTTLIMMVILPIIVYPLFSFVSAYMMMKSTSEIRKSTTKIVMCRPNKSLEGAIGKYFVKSKAEIIYAALSTDEIRAGIISGKYSVYLDFPENFDSAIASGSTCSVIVKYDRSNEKSGFASVETVNAINEYKDGLVSRNISGTGLNPSLFDPFDVAGKNIATSVQMGGSLLAKVLPIMIIMFATLGSFYPAIDVTAMEKERGTLETLLLAPVTNLEIMFGKFLAVFSLTMFSIMLNLISIALTATHGILLIKSSAAFSRVGDFINFSITPFTIVAIFIFMIPAACLMSAIMLQVAIFARNFKEAQNYMTPILLIFMLPPMVSMLPGYELTTATAMIPIINLTLLLKGMLAGNYSVYLALVTFAVNLAFSAAALFMAATAFSSEAVLFRPSEDLDSLCFWRFPSLKISQEMSLITLFFVFNMALLYFAGSFLQTIFPIKTGLLLTEILLILIPSIIFVKSVYGNFLGYIGFRLPSAGNLFYSVVIGTSGFVFTVAITALMSHFVSPPEDMMKELQKSLTAGSAGEFFVLAVITAVLPGICEEIMFRGAILPVLYKKYGRIASCALCGLLFGLFHLSPFRILPTAIIGFYLSLLRIHTGSIIPSMLCHFTNNFIIIFVSSIGENPFFSRPESVNATLPVALAASLLFMAFPFIVSRMMKTENDPPTI